MDKSLENRLRDAFVLTSLPGAAMRIIDIARDPDAEPDELIGVVTLDPALTARVLKVANSALYARSRRVTNLSQALVVMGMRGIINIALGFSFHGLLHGINGGGGQFWRRSVLAALAGREIAQRVALHLIEDVFIAALLQDIGILALEQAEPGLYATLPPVEPAHDQRVALEHARLQLDHAEVGGWLLSRWNLPNGIVEAVRYSHEPRGRAGSAPIVAACVAVAGKVADIWLQSERDRATAGALDALKRWLHGDAELLSSIIAGVDACVLGVQDLFDIERFTAEELEAVQTQARELLELRIAEEVAAPKDQPGGD